MTSAHKRAVKRNGEWIYREDEKLPKIKASLTNSTRATFSLANRACLFEGLSEIGPTVGEYIIRKDDGKKYMVQTVHIQPRSPGLNYIFLAMCNQLVTLSRPVSSGRFEIYAENVPVFMDTTTRRLKPQNDGLLDEAIYIIQIPTRYEIQSMDRVYLMRGCDPIDKCDFFRVDSINDSLTPIDSNVDRTGVDVMQLTADARTGKSFEPAEPGGEVDENGNPTKNPWG